MELPARIDLHTHSFFSDGVLLPSEMLQRAQALGYGALAITDHADASNLDELARQLTRFSREGIAGHAVQFIPGVEITHVPPVQIAPLARRARRLGMGLIVVHGETLVEPVARGTNRAAVECPDVDILAHPGLITEDEAALARANGVLLEITSRGGHSLANGHVARVARLTGVRLVVNTDTHSPADMMDQARAHLVALAAGLCDEEAQAAVVTAAQEAAARAAARRALSI